MRKKVSIIGGGNVGASAAQLLAHDGIADVVLFDIAEGMPQGKALDMAEACPLWNSSVSVKGTNSYRDTEKSDVIVITAGIPRKPGMSRDDLLKTNAEVVKSVAAETSKLSPDAVVIVVTNPMDVMAYVACKTSGCNHRKVLGMGGILDSARFRTFISFELGVSPSDVEALVMGGHGDQMVPMPRYTTIKGVPITKILPPEKIAPLIERTRNGGAEIVSLLKTGSAYYAPAAATCQMIRAILFDEKRILPCAVYLEGQYGVRDIYVGVPAVLGARGIEKVIELELNEEERADFDRSVSAVKALLEKITV
ncbi:MAG: malate dehydrogenase [Nitrospirae bacterium]|nr:malate dehydrogenase [Nitrospirota bacterium]MCL5421172.1 malate dehydrogenase [Nitrospirota bacterium]